VRGGVELRRKKNRFRGFLMQHFLGDTTVREAEKRLSKGSIEGVAHLTKVLPPKLAWIL